MAKQKDSKQKKMNVRVDFTPMVDMIMLLVTFFMLCTSLLKPQTMQITMPSDKEDIKDEQRNQAKASEAVTIYAVGENRIFYTEGKEGTNHYVPLTETKYGKDGIRAELMKKNVVALKKVEALKAEFQTRDINEASKKEYADRLSVIKGEKGTPTVIIKVADEATFKNMIDVLDEMNICAIGKYMIDKFTPEDKALFKGKGVKFEN